MSERERDAHSGTATTGHEWDGIKELDTPLPRWWLYIFYACIAAAIAYWIAMPAWPLPGGYTHGVLGFSDRKNVERDVGALRAARAPSFEQIAKASPQDVLNNPQLLEFARAAGESAFGDNCRTCHGAGGAGAPGYPNLADDVWLWDGTLGGIEQTIRYGIRSDRDETRLSQMPAFGRDGILKPAEVADVAEYVLTLSPEAARRTNPDPVKAARGATTFAAQCAVCHKADGGGDHTLGAPSLRDDIWLYGGTREEVVKQVSLGRNGVMPAWDRRFDAGTIRALSIYVYTLGGGVADPPAPTAAPASLPEPTTPKSETARP